MNIKSIVYFSLLGFITVNGNAQNASDELLRINDNPFSVGEFERIYTKNLDLIQDAEQKNVDNYIDLFVLYKLKVAKAFELELDKRTGHINELNSHRSQLAEQYITNQETLERLAKEAYERSKYEIKASHIIFLADEFVTPSDTLKAYNKAIEVREEILNGMKFSDAAIQFSEDPSAKTNNGELGYFSVLRMVYPFETGAYNTSVGQVSMPIRSQFGYHLINVEDKRLKRGKISISQITLDVKDESQENVIKKQIDEIYNLLLQGENFENLVSKYSHDLTTKDNKGKFNQYEPGLISIKGLDEAVFDLKEAGSFSKPFRSGTGWHIVKLNSEDDFPSYDKMKEFYLRKVQSDNRSRIITEELITHLKEKYNYRLNKANYKHLLKDIEKNVETPNWTAKLKSDKVLAEFANQKVTNSDFIQYVENKGVNFQAIKPIENGVNYVFDEFISDKIKTYYNDNLEVEFPEFKSTVQEFKEGLLLFDLMDQEIWKKVKTDTLGYTNYYQSHLNDFTKNESIKGKVYMSGSRENINKALKLAKKNFGKQVDFLKLDSKMYRIIEDDFEINDSRLPKNYILKQGVSEIFEQDGKFYFVVADEFFPKKTMDLEEAKQSVIYEYQQQYEEQWINDLKNSAKIEINDDVLEQLKFKYNQK